MTALPDIRSWIASNLTLALTSGILLSALSYCANYGLLWVVDPKLLSAFSAVDLASSFSLLLIPLLSSTVVTWGVFLTFQDVVSGKIKFRDKFKVEPKATVALWFFALLTASIYISSSSDVYELSYKLGVGLTVVVLAYLVPRFSIQVAILHIKEFKQHRINASVSFLGLLAWTVSSFGAHTAVERIQSWKTSKLYYVKGRSSHKIVIIFASPQRAVIYDGNYLRLVDASNFSHFATAPDRWLLDATPYLTRLYRSLENY